MGIEIIDLVINPDHIYPFIKYLPKYSVSYIAKKIKGRTSRILRQHFRHLKELRPDHLGDQGCYHGSVDHGWEVVEKYISTQINSQKEREGL